MSELPGSREERIQRALARERDRAFRLGLRVVLGCLVAVAVWVAIENTFWNAVLYGSVILLFIGLIAWSLRIEDPERRERWAGYVLPAFAAVAFTLVVVIRNPFDVDPIPPQIRIRFGDEVYLFLFPLLTLFAYSARMVLVSTAVTIVVWSAGFWWIASLDSSTFPPSSDRSLLGWDERMAIFLAPSFVSVSAWVKQVLTLALVGVAVAVFVNRARNLALRQVEAETERTALSRYFPPNLVEDLAGTEDAWTTRRENVAVVFVDMVGFTALSSGRDPDRVIALLRSFHNRLSHEVFVHGGTLEKYLGDGLMATFGTPRPSGQDATNAICCAKAMVTSVASWSREREARGEPSIAIRVGVHYGPVVLGNVGDEQRLEFTTVGETVNIASRLESLCRDNGTTVLASRDAMDAARAEGAGEGQLAGFSPAGGVEIRGTGERIEVSRLAESAVSAGQA